MKWKRSRIKQGKIMAMFILPMGPSSGLAFGEVVATRFEGRKETAAGVSDILLHSPHSSIMTFSAMTNQQQPWVAGYALHGSGLRDFWSGALVMTPSMTFLSPVPEKVLPDVVDVIMSAVHPEKQSVLPICTEASITPALLKAWEERTQTIPQIHTSIDYYLHHEGVMDEIPVVEHPYRMVHVTQDNLMEQIPLVCEAENGLPAGLFNLLSVDQKRALTTYYTTDFEDRERFLWLDEADRCRAAVTAVRVGSCGALLSKFQQIVLEGTAGEADPHAAFAEIAEVARALHQQGRWVGILDSAAQPEGVFATAVRSAGFSKVTSYQYVALPYPERSKAMAPSSAALQ